MTAAAATPARPAGSAGHAADAARTGGIHLEVVTPEKLLVTEMVDEVVLPGSEGYFGVLPGHAPLLASLGVGILTYRRGETRRYLALAWGFTEVLPDRVSVLAEIAEKADAIDLARAEAARDRAMARLRGKDPDTDFLRAQTSLQKALIRIQVSQGIGPNQAA